MLGSLAVGKGDGEGRGYVCVCGARVVFVYPSVGG